LIGNNINNNSSNNSYEAQEKLLAGESISTKRVRKHSRTSGGIRCLRNFRVNRKVLKKKQSSRKKKGYSKVTKAVKLELDNEVEIPTK
jgi:hypothetical protein